MAERIGSLLVRRGLLTPAELEEGLRAQLIYGGRLGTILVELDLLSLDELADALSEQLRYPVVTQAQLDAAPPAAAKLLTPEQAEAHQAFPFGLEGRKCRMAMAAPHDPAVQDALAFITGLRILPYLVPELRLAYVLQQRYGVQRKERFIRLAPQRQDHGRRRGAAAAEEPASLGGPSTRHEDKESLFGSLGGDQFLASDEDDPQAAPALSAEDRIREAARALEDEEPPEFELTAEEEEIEVEVEPAAQAKRPSGEKRRPSGPKPSPVAAKRENAPAPEAPAEAAPGKSDPPAAPDVAPEGVTASAPPAPSPPPAELQLAAPKEPSSEEPPYEWRDDDAPLEEAAPSGDSAEARAAANRPEPDATAAAEAPAPRPERGQTAAQPPPAVTPAPPAFTPALPRPPYPPLYRPPPPPWQGAYPPPARWGYPPPPPPPWAQPPARGWAPPPPAPVIRSRHPNDPDRLFDEESLDSWSLRSDEYSLVEEVRPPPELEEAVARLHGHRRERAHRVEPLERADFWEFLPWSQGDERALEVETDGRTREVPPMESVTDSCRFAGDDARALELEPDPPVAPARPWHEVGIWTPEAADDAAGTTTPPPSLPLEAPDVDARASDVAAPDAPTPFGEPEVPASPSAEAAPSANSSERDSASGDSEITPTAAPPVAQTASPDEATSAPAHATDTEAASGPKPSETSEVSSEEPVQTTAEAPDTTGAGVPTPSEAEAAAALPMTGDWSSLIPDAQAALARVQQAMDAAREPAAVSEALLDYCTPRFGRGFILLENEGTARVWRGFGPGSDDPEVTTAALPVLDCKPLKDAAQSHAPVRLATGGAEAEEELAVRLRAQSPYQVLAAVHCGARPIAFVYAECPIEPLPSDAASELQRVVELAERAHARLQTAT